MVVLLVNSILMIVSSLVIYYYGRRKVSNLLIWMLVPISRGIQWFVEFLVETYPTFDDLFITDRLEITFSFASSFFLLAAVLEFTRYLNSPNGKLAISSGLSLISFFILVLPKDAVIALESTDFLTEFFFTTEMMRFTYGFIIPFLALIVMVLSLSNYYPGKQGEVERSFDKRIGVLISIFLLFFCIIEGFDVNDVTYSDLSNIATIDEIYVATRGALFAIFLLAPILIIITSDLGLKHLFIIQHTGVPIFIYDFETHESIMEAEQVLTSGFFVALMGLSQEISTTQDELTVNSDNLFYSIIKRGERIYAIQSLATNNQLKERFAEFIDAIEKDGKFTHIEDGGFDEELKTEVVATFIDLVGRNTQSMPENVSPQ